MNECRLCLHWKRRWMSSGECYAQPHGITSTHESNQCGIGRFQPKAVTVSDVPTTVNPVTPWVSPSGAKSSDEAKRYDLINAEFLDLMADRLAYGAEKHGDPYNYRLGKDDAAFFRDRVNHLIRHAVKLGNATTQEDRAKQIAAIAAGCNMLAWLNAHAGESK